MRIFIALNLSKELKAYLQNIIQPLKTLVGIKWVEMDNLHLTFNFLGELSKTEFNNLITLLPSLIATFKPFKITTHNLVFFPPNERPRIIAVNLKINNKLQILHQSLQQKVNELKLKPQGWKDFKPHISLGRIKEPRSILAAVNLEDLNKKILPQEVLVNSLEVMQSHLNPGGPDYEILKSFSLASDRDG